MTLSEMMDFDHVIQVTATGDIVDGPPGLYSPEVYDSEHGIEGLDGWALMNGYSGQDRYSGPVMHASEYIGGAMERDIRATPGFYVAVVVTWLDDESEDDEDDVAGWAVAYREES